MNNITLHIEYLLRHHDCVIVPGIGAFVAISRPAFIESESGIYLPPQRYIVFNSAIHTDDGLLANSYGRHHGVSFETAHALLANDIEQLSRTLDRTGVSLIGHIGRLHKSDDGRLSFMPALSVENAMQQVGMYRISCIKHDSNSTTVTERNDEIVSTPGKTFDDRYYYIPVHKTFARIAASLVLALTVALAYIVKPYNGLNHPVEASVLPVEKVLRLHSHAGQRDKKAQNITSQKKFHDSTLSVPTYPADSEPAEVSVAPSDHIFNLVIGAFGSEREAERYISQTAADSDKMTIHHRGRHYLVVLRSSDDRDELSAYLSDHSVTERFKGAWIWEKKNN